MLVPNTPIEQHWLAEAGVPVWVKREDLCCLPPGPPFSKMRGVVAHIAKRPEQIIGVLDTYHSKAGWAVAAACQQLGKQPVNFWPRYQHEAADVIREPQRRSLDLGARLEPLAAGRSAVLFHIARKALVNRYGTDAYMMPNALKLRESVTENAVEAFRTAWPPKGTVVISISSGTVAAGVLSGMDRLGVLRDYTVVLHMGYSRPQEPCARYIRRMGGLSELMPVPFRFVDEGYEYADSTDVAVPFPCNRHYDSKAWAWLVKNVQSLRHPVVFWNIGA